jgi:multidrug resistance efflux pump
LGNIQPALRTGGGCGADSTGKPGPSAATNCVADAQRLGAEAGVAQAKTELRKAQVNFGRTRILSPVDGYVTNLLAQLGDYVNVGVNTISVVDAHSFWIDGYFEETNIVPIRVGDRADIKLMGYGPIAVVMSTASPARSTSKTHSRTGRALPPSIRSSPGYGSRRESPCVSASIKCRRVSFSYPE